MRRINLMYALMAFVCTSLTSCFYSEKDEPVETLYSGFMTGKTDHDGYFKTFRNDFGSTYSVKKDDKNEKHSPDTTYRVVAALALSENSARIVDIAPTISYVAPNDTLIPDSLRVKDPIEIESYYIGGGYLNMYVGIRVKNENTKHALIYTRMDYQDRLEFTIYHNAYGDEPVYLKHAYVSIPLQSYGLAQDDTVFLSCKGYKEDYDLELIYK